MFLFYSRFVFLSTDLKCYISLLVYQITVYFPFTKVIFKSCKLIPVMVGGILIQGEEVILANS